MRVEICQAQKHKLGSLKIPVDTFVQSISRLGGSGREGFSAVAHLHRLVSEIASDAKSQQDQRRRGRRLPDPGWPENPGSFRHRGGRVGLYLSKETSPDPCPERLIRPWPVPELHELKSLVQSVELL